MTRYGSDVVVDRLVQLGIPYLTMNPGASFRGLHDSLVNNDEAPPMLDTPHEKIAVGMAHGYAKATGQPMGVIIHDLVGLLHATLGVFYAYVDRCPILLLGGAGPMNQAHRRPWIDWIHTANSQNESVRPFTKFDDHPFSVEAIPDSLDRAYRVATMHPQGPTYVALDAELQEQPVATIDLVPTPTLPTSPGPDVAALAAVAAALADSERPAIVLGYVGRDHAMWQPVQELAELLGAAVIDTGLRSSFPSRHPLNATGTSLVNEADVVLLLDVKDIGQQTGLLGKDDVGRLPKLAAGARLLDIGFGDLGISSWAVHNGQVYRPDVQIVADTSLAIPALLTLIKNGQPSDITRQEWRTRVTRESAGIRAGWQAKAEQALRKESITLPALAAATWEAVRDHDWVLTSGTADGWATRLWDLDRPYRHPGKSLGTATQIGISLGVALAHQNDPDKLVVALQPDGDLLFDASALWVASHHRLPMLVVMVNNRSYGNDLTHQRVMAGERDHPLSRANIGVSLNDPAPDFAAMARSFGWSAIGPVATTDELPLALEKAITILKRDRLPVLVDVICEEPT